VLVPLYGFLRGDTVGLLVLVHDGDLVGDIAHRMQRAATMRVAPLTSGRVFVRGRELDPQLTVAQAGLTALDRVDVIPEEAP
jgi:hypothetical protein